ncbi:hypothetical protein PAPYR_7180 [Paratrimastix pyriformis]|uniref:Uncharacterized protein n=1 Tax=Paratrimastix pyriformis TaxID=342808 RepID=A0ABQ8UGT5_9EUKA|nr:hypothetical protein PAPYR_7180 [Paratrimastix pyriformis]
MNSERNIPFHIPDISHVPPRHCPGFGPRRQSPFPGPLSACLPFALGRGNPLGDGSYHGASTLIGGPLAPFAAAPPPATLDGPHPVSIA